MAVPWCFLVGSKFCKQVWQRFGVLSVLVAGGSPARRLGGLHRRRAPATWRSMSATTRWRSGAGARAVEAALGLGGRPFRYMNQVHGNEVAGIGAAAAAGTVPDCPGCRQADAPTADAMVSLGEPLAVMVADCVPVVLVGDRAGGGSPGPRRRACRAPRRRVRRRPGGRGAHARTRRGGAQRLDRPVRLRTLLRGPRGHARRRGRPGSRRLVHHLPRHTGPGPAGRRPQPTAGRRRERSNTPATAPWKTNNLFSYRRDPNTGRFAGLVWTGAGPRPRTRTATAANE